ncbi:MAG: hypothetical protein Q7J98_12190 [Kiritimatiellia bacterium]|nr:hypothetical protein [Kiritimatiellia bacterium]
MRYYGRESWMRERHGRGTATCLERSRGSAMNDLKRVVVIGCSGAGAIAALSLKKLCDTLDVTIIREADEQGLLTRCATPYICCGEVMVEPSYKDD